MTGGESCCLIPCMCFDKDVSVRRLNGCLVSTSSSCCMCMCVCGLFTCVHECATKWASECACSINRCELVHERGTCAHMCPTEKKRGCVYTCGCGVTHSCTAGHAFSAAPCCTTSTWHNWRRNLAPNDAHCCECHTFSLWAPCPCPSPCLSEALFRGSYPAEEQGKRQIGFFMHMLCSSDIINMTSHG